MRVLAFDTATPRTAVALRDMDSGANLCMRSELDLSAADDPPTGARPAHAGQLLSLIQRMLDDSGSGWEAVDRIAVGIGPGTFTGLRIGIATAQALATATGLPLVGVSTLQALASAAHERQPARATLAVIDARRGEAFVAGWAAGEDPLNAAAALPPRVLTPEQLERLAAGSSENPQAVGDGALKFADLLVRAGVEVPPAESPLHRVSAREHCRIAAVLTPSADGRIEPEYLRLPDAEIAKS